MSHPRYSLTLLGEGNRLRKIFLEFSKIRFNPEIENSRICLISMTNFLLKELNWKLNIPMSGVKVNLCAETDNSRIF